MILINNISTLVNQDKINDFLNKMKALLPTNEYTIEQNEKNINFSREYPLKDKDYKQILQSLTANECVSIEPNNNTRYEDAEVYKFIKNTEINVFGEKENLDIYIKMYIKEYDSYDMVIVISFHKEGVYD